MSLFPQIQELVNALGWTLIHFLWQGLCIVFVYWLVCRLTRPGNALIRYWAGMLSFLFIAIVPLATFGIYWNPESGAAVTAAIATPLVPVSADLSFSLIQLLRAGMEPALPFVVMLWAIGVMVLSARAFLGWIGANRLVRLDTSAVSGSLQNLFQNLMLRLGIKQIVRVLQSSKVTVPTVVGWLKPVILLPIAVINRLPEDQLEMVIAHELGHIRRYDYLFNLLQVVLETLFFYHPAIRWMSNQVRQEREHCCDDLVIAQCEKPVLYARALANLEIMRDEPVPVLLMAATGGDLVKRLRRIVHHELPGNQSGFAQLAVMVGVATLVGLSAGRGLDVANLYTDAESFSNKVTSNVADPLVDSRSQWVRGLSEYSRLSVQTNRIEAEKIKADSLAALAELHNLTKDKITGSVDAIASKPMKMSEPERNVIVDTQIDSSKMLLGFGANSQEEALIDDMSFWLASSSLPSKTHFEVDQRITNPEDSVNVQFEIQAQTVVAPVYPFKARRKQIDGFVRLEFSVDQKGHARDIKVVEAQPLELFEKSAISALEKWVFKVDENHSESVRLYQIFDFDMEKDNQQVSKRDRRCEIAGSRICGLKVYN
ncbi:MAG: bla regulator protein BlaR1 [Lysobacterales bacterium]|jgi:bla regulator protein BlaR1